MHARLFEPVQLGDIPLKNRIIMAPMTRDRAGPDDVPNAIMVEYYRQRASAGLIVTEGTQPSAVGKGYWRTPGIYSAAQVDGWRRVTDAVHAAGGRIALQIMHCGRVVVPANRGYDADIIAPSALAMDGKVPGPDGVPVPTAMPRALDAAELPALAEGFAVAARNAMSAGFDAVELHCASGYLINQFLNPASNQRDDGYGGDAARRAAFPLMVLRAMADAIGAGRVGFRISPGNPYNGMDVSDPWGDFAPFLRGASALGLAYLHIVDMGDACPDTLGKVGTLYDGALVANNMLTADSALARLSGRVQAVSFGRAFIANPDLPARIAGGHPLAKPDYSLLYTGEERGYCDYPAL
ncbi:MAG: alkene reductase [Sphingomonadaceae bacterium]|nr:alkene reductase [Sphingomonadaceae bacterium]